LVLRGVAALPAPVDLCHRQVDGGGGGTCSMPRDRRPLSREGLRARWSNEPRTRIPIVGVQRRGVPPGVTNWRETHSARRLI
jgi:hypothetical protein